MVVWLTGLSGAGKTTIGTLMYERLKPHMPDLILIDGDVIRDLFGASLGFDEEARKMQIGRIQRLSKFLSDQNISVITAALYCHPELMQWNREHLKDYFEVYVNTPLDVVKGRDVKGLYAKAEAGEMPHVVGIDVPWHAPENPDLIVETTSKQADELALDILNHIQGKMSADSTKQAVCEELKKAAMF